MIGIVDYGIGNLRSVEKAFHAVGAEAIVSDDDGRLAECDGLVLPGVGAFGDGVDGLRSSGLDRVVIRAVEDETPVLGLCLGLQLLFEGSDEFGSHRGLGVLRGRVVRFPDTVRVVPHTGWNSVHAVRPHPLFSGLDEDPYFYFVHSFHVVADDRDDVIGETEYDGVVFPSVCAKANLYGAQCHPEKSHTAGLKLLGNFARIVAAR